MASTDIEPTSRESARPFHGAIDGDVHPTPKEGIQDLAPFLEPAVRDLIGLGRKWARGLPGAAFSMPVPPYMHPGGNLRVDALPPGGGPPCSDPHYVVTDLLDRYALSAAVLLGSNVLTVGGVSSPVLAAALCSAYNRWLADVWLSVDPRFKGAVAVAPQAPELAAKEIAKWADDRRFVQVFIAGTDVALGRQSMDPIFGAATEHGFPVGLHPGGEGSGVNRAMTALDAPTTYMEMHTSMDQGSQANLISLITEGVFERFPTLKVALIEGGWAWLPSVMWKLDKNWKGLRREVPWVSKPPSEYIIEHVRFTSQPIPEPPEKAHLFQTLDMMHAAEVLMFSTDYPHWDNDNPHFALRGWPADLVRKMTHETPRAYYRDLG